MRIRELERENRELRRANEILKAASAYAQIVGRKLPIQEVVDDRDGLLVLDLLNPMFSSELKDILDPSDSGD